MPRLRLTDSRIPHSAGSRPHLVALLSGKGGVGKSVLAFNLSERLAAVGYRVLLVDADISCGNQHILANVHVEAGLCEVARSERTFSEVRCPLAPGFDLLASVGDRAEDHPDEATVAGYIGTRLPSDAAGYDVIVLDCASGVSTITDTAMACAGQAVVVLVPELTSIADAYGLCKRGLQEGAAVSLLVNRAADDAEAGQVAQKFQALCERFLGRVPGWLGWIPEDEVLRRSVARQCPAAQVASQSPAIQAITEVSGRLARPVGPAPDLQRQVNANPITADTEG